MKQFASFLFSYFLFITISSATIMGMERPASKFFPGVPSREKDLVTWLDKSHIPTLKALAARRVYRRISEDQVYLHKHVAVKSKDIRDLVYRSATKEMMGSVKAYAAFLYNSKNPDEFEIISDENEQKGKKVSYDKIFRYALNYGRHDIIRLLHDVGVRAHKMAFQVGVLWKHQKYQHEDVIRNLNQVASCKIIDLKDPMNNWHLMVAAAQNSQHSKYEYCLMADIFYRLLELGGDPNARQSSDGKTVLMLLCEHNGCRTCIKLLLDRGADKTLVSDKGDTAIMKALINSNIDALQELQERGESLVFKVGNQTSLEYVREKYTNDLHLKTLLRIAYNKKP